MFVLDLLVAHAAHVVAEAQFAVVVVAAENRDLGDHACDNLLAHGHVERLAKHEATPGSALLSAGQQVGRSKSRARVQAGSRLHDRHDRLGRDEAGVIEIELLEHAEVAFDLLRRSVARGGSAQTEGRKDLEGAEARHGTAPAPCSR